MQCHGSIIWSTHERLYTDYNQEAHALEFGTTMDHHLDVDLERLTLDIAKAPRSANLRIARARVLLRMQLPELAASDAYKALLLCKASPPSHTTAVSRSEGALLLCQSLFFAQDFDECEQRISDFRESSRTGSRPLLPEWLTKLRKLRQFARKCRAQNKERAGDDTHASLDASAPEDSDLQYGQIRAPAYPWIRQQFRRKSSTCAAMDKELDRVSLGVCRMERSLVPATLVQDCYGIYAKIDISAEDEMIFKEKPALVATDHAVKRCCEFCFVSMEGMEQTSISTGSFCKSELSARF